MTTNGSKESYPADELRGYPPQVYEFLRVMKQLRADGGGQFYTPIPEEWRPWSNVCEEFGLVQVDVPRSTEVLSFLWLTPKGEAALTLGPKTEVPTAKSDPTWTRDQQARAVYVNHPDWTLKAIAEHIGCSPKQLTPKRAPLLAKAMAAYRASTPPSGSKDRNGTVEAWDDEG